MGDKFDLSVFLQNEPVTVQKINKLYKASLFQLCLHYGVELPAASHKATLVGKAIDLLTDAGMLISDEAVLGAVPNTPSTPTNMTCKQALKLKEMELGVSKNTTAITNPVRTWKTWV